MRSAKHSLEEGSEGLALSAGRMGAPETPSLGFSSKGQNALNFHLLPPVPPLACSAAANQAQGAGSLEPQALAGVGPRDSAPRWACSKEPR